MKRQKQSKFAEGYDKIRNATTHPQVVYKNPKYIPESINIGERDFFNIALFKMEIR
jgi:dihydrodipicolinate synthase/N-acetylneuraminate lyase